MVKPNLENEDIWVMQIEIAKTFKDLLVSIEEQYTMHLYGTSLVLLQLVLLLYSL